MKRWILSVFAGMLVVGVGHADPPTVWKDYDSPLVGIHLQVKRAWQEVNIKETKETGTAAFNLSPHTTISIVRQRWDQPFDVWISSPILTQIFKPGYKVQHAELAGRKSILVTGVSLDDRQQQSYYSDRSPFVDEITFTAPSDEWDSNRDSFDTVKKTLHWTR